MMIREALARVVSWLRREDGDRDFNEELAAHVDFATEDLVHRGHSAAEARRRALIHLGGLSFSRETHRESRGLVWLDGIAQDVRGAVRALKRNPTETLTGIVTLAVAIGVNAAVFSVMNAVLFRGFPHVERNDRLIYVTGPRGGGDLSYPDFVDWRTQARAFESLATVADAKVTCRDADGVVERCDATRVTANTFGLLGVRPVLGRDFTATDEAPGAARVGALSYGFWERRFGRDPGVVGRSISIDGDVTTVVGVFPKGFSFPQKADLWLPLVPTEELRRRDARQLWFAVGRLKDGETKDHAAAEMATIAGRLAAAYPETDHAQAPSLATFDEFFLGPNARLMYVALFGAVGFVLLIACANLANLALMRALRRSGELTMRIAIGASRRRIARQLLCEAVLLSSLGGSAGWFVAQGSVRVYERFASPPEWFEHVLDYSMDYRVMAYLAAISIGTGVLFALLPVVRLSRLDVNTVLKDGGRGRAGTALGRYLSALLLMAETTLAIVLLVAAGVMVRSFLYVYTADIGVKTDQLLVAFLALPSPRYNTADKRLAFYDDLTAQVQTTPGVAAVTVASSYPGGGAALRAYDVDGVSAHFSADDPRRPRVGTVVVGRDYFAAVGADLVSGRGFTDGDVPDGLRVAIVNQQFVRQHWPGQNPLGRRLRLVDRQPPGEWLTIVGVAPNILQDDPGRSSVTPPLIYLPFRQQPRGDMWVLTRTLSSPSSVSAAFRRDVQNVDAGLAIWLGPYPLDTRLSRRYADRERDSVLLTAFAVIAMLLAAAGLYAMTAQSVSERTREIGIRIAMGAGRRAVIWFVLVQGIWPVGAGLVVGVVASVGINRLLQAELVHVSPADPASVILAAVALVAAGLLGCVVPARRATRVNPIEALGSR
jgi:putative ABC transport system permease protein